MDSKKRCTAEQWMYHLIAVLILLCSAFEFLAAQQPQNLNSYKSITPVIEQIAKGVWKLKFGVPEKSTPVVFCVQEAQIDLMNRSMPISISNPFTRFL